MSRFSVVMPAHDEESVIAASLHVLLAGAGPGEVDLVVVCNSCSDKTAEVARASAPQARVLEIDIASKSAALNAGDAVVSEFPRFYVDADIGLRVQDLRTLAEALETRGYLAVSPSATHLWAQSPSALVRSYYRLWSQLPAGVARISGSGAFALSAAGRQRFGSWPDVIADDYYCDTLFADAEKLRVAGVQVQLDVPLTVTALIRRKARIRNGNLQVRANLVGAFAVYRLSSVYQVVRRNPRLVRDVPSYVFVTAAARLLAAYNRKRGRGGGWYHEESRGLARKRMPGRQPNESPYADPRDVTVEGD